MNFVLMSLVGHLYPKSPGSLRPSVSKPELIILLIFSTCIVLLNLLQKLFLTWILPCKTPGCPGLWSYCLSLSLLLSPLLILPSPFVSPVLGLWLCIGIILQFLKKFYLCFLGSHLLLSPVLLCCFVFSVQGISLNIRLF